MDPELMHDFHVYEQSDQAVAILARKGEDWSSDDCWLIGARGCEWAWSGVPEIYVDGLLRTLDMLRVDGATRANLARRSVEHRHEPYPGFRDACFAILILAELGR